MLTRTREISNSDDVIDSRDVIARIDALQEERDSFEPEELSVGDLADPAIAVDDRPAQAWAEENPEDAAELKALEALAEEAEGYAPDWHHGCALIRDSYFEDYARQLAEDTGAIPNDAQWPCTCIDWEQAAKELRMDYSGVEFGDVTYWVR